MLQSLCAQSCDVLENTALILLIPQNTKFILGYLCGQTYREFDDILDYNRIFESVGSL
jgi:hypothetical protein